MKKIYNYSPKVINFFAVILLILAHFLLFLNLVMLTVSVIMGLIGIAISVLFFAVSFKWFKIAREKKAGTFDIEKYLKNIEIISEDKGAAVTLKYDDSRPIKRSSKMRSVITQYTHADEYPNSFVVFDLETTGLNAGADEILQIGAIKYDNGVETQRFMMYSKPLKPIPRAATKINGINAKTVANAPDIKTVLERFIEFVGEYTLIAHNASFDMEFLQTFLHACGMPIVDNAVIDTLYLSRIYLHLPNYKLPTIKEYYEINVDSHEALSDCIVCSIFYLDYWHYINPQYDDITDEAYKCFIDDAGEPISDAMRAILDKKCKDNNGKCYRTAAKSANFAVIASKFHQNSNRVEQWRERGYKVTTLDALLKHWELS